MRVSFTLLFLLFSFGLFSQNESESALEMEPEQPSLSAAPEFEELETGSPIYDLNGTFKILRDQVLDGEANESQRGSFYTLRMRQIDQKFIARYAGISNDSEFIGDIYQSSREFGLRMIRFEQIDQGYMGYYVGFWKDGKIQGTWYNSGGNSGDFILLKD